MEDITECRYLGTQSKAIMK